MWQIQIKQRQLSTQHVGKRWDALLQDVVGKNKFTWVQKASGQILGRKKSFKLS